MWSFVAMFALAVTPQSMPVPPLLQNVHRIVMLGDSITELGARPHGYVTLVQDSLNSSFGPASIEVMNAGISGQKSNEMHARFQKDVLDQKPQMVTISVGVNDVWHDFRTPEWSGRVPTGDSGRGIKLPVYIREVEAMVDEAERAGVKVVLLSPTLIYEDLDCAENKRLSEYVNAEREIARRHAAVFVDLNRAFREVVSAYQKHAEMRTLLLTVDGVHMNDAGNALMSDMILKTLGVPAVDNVSPH
jgi:acyl-CoA thioesterase I